MILKASPEAIASTGKGLVNNAESYLAEVKVLYDTVDNLTSSWQGSDNVSFANTVNGYRENIEALGKVVGNYGVFLQETANKLAELQSEIANSAASL